MHCHFIYLLLFSSSFCLIDSGLAVLDNVDISVCLVCIVTAVEYLLACNKVKYSVILAACKKLAAKVGTHTCELQGSVLLAHNKVCVIVAFL